MAQSNMILRIHQAFAAHMLGLLLMAPLAGAATAFAQSPWFREETATIQGPAQVRLSVNSPKDDNKANRPTRVMAYALPNGNTIEQTLGCKMAEGLDWHYDIQHVAAQVRLLRELTPDERLVLVCAEAGGLSWPSWRSNHNDANQVIARLLDEWRTEYGGADAKMTLAGHSGGGSFIFGVIEAADAIPAYIDRIAMLDANYNFDAAKHSEKLLNWLQGDASRRLIVLAYDDRNIELNGKKVVGPTGGTYRATERMVEAFKPHLKLVESRTDPFIEYSGLEGRVRFFVHPNPQNKILHTALVGEINGLVEAQTLGTPAEGKWGKFGGPRAYEKWIQAEPTRAEPIEARGAAINTTKAPTDANPSPSLSLPGKGVPERPANALGGRALMEKIAPLKRDEREAAVFKELTSGNFPNFLRRFVSVPIKDGDLSGTIEVMPDYLAIGSDEDFYRIPMTPQTAQRIADRFGCVLPTRKMVDAIDAAAEVRLAPQPLTKDRESVATFMLSNDKIEQQRKGKSLGALTIGAKKDIVVSPRIFERANRLVIYGWRQLNGQPIQPLTNVHVNWYVDYSHGVRLVKAEMQLNGKPTSIAELLEDAERCGIVSDEGVVHPPRYPTE
jgi:hypothetical protein